MTLDERIAALTEAEAKMTPGMWRWNATAGCSQDYYEGPLDSLVSSDDEPVCDFGDCTQYYPSSGTPPSGSDMAGIVALRNDALPIIAELQSERDELITAAKHVIPYAETPKEPFVENWAWQIRMMGEDRRAAYRSLARAEANAVKWESAAATHCNRANKAEAERDRLAERCKYLEHYTPKDLLPMVEVAIRIGTLAEKGTTDGN